MIGHVIFDVLRRTATGDEARPVRPWEDYGLYLVEYDAPRPEPKIYRVDIEGRSGTIDMTEWAGDVFYNDRTVTVRLRDMLGRADDICNALLGRRCRVQFDVDDPDYYYEGRCEAIKDTTRRHVTDLTLTLTCHPFKHPVTAPREESSGLPPSGVDAFTISAGESATVTLYQDKSFASVDVSGLETGETATLTINGTDYEIENNGDQEGEFRLIQGANSIALTSDANDSEAEATLIYTNRVV